MRSKKGGTSIFLAIILAAVIFVESIYLSLIIDINRRMTIDRALKQQVEQILSTYDERLFLEYGLYAFYIDDIDQQVYRNTLDATGYSYGEDIYIKGYKTINTFELEKAISSYYSYRAAGIAFKNIRPYLEYAFDSLDDYGFFDKIESFKANNGRKVLHAVSTSTEKILEVLESDEIQELFDITTKETDLLDKVIEYVQTIDEYELDFDKDFCPEDMFSMRFFDTVIDFSNKSSDFIENDLLTLCMAHYATNNFECVVKELDTNIRGTSFRDINPEECNDMEYIISGLRGAKGVYSVGHFISAFVLLSEVINLLLNEDFMKVCKKVAQIISKILSIVLEGVTIPEWVIEMVIIMYCALAISIKDMYDLYQGETVNVFKISSAPEPICDGIEMDYRDFSMSIAIVSGNMLTTRMLKIFEEKYGDLYTCIEIGTTYRGYEYSARSGYELYGF